MCTNIICYNRLIPSVRIIDLEVHYKGMHKHMFLHAQRLKFQLRKKMEPSRLTKKVVEFYKN